MLTVGQSSPEDADAIALIRAYMTEVVSRWHARPAEDHEVVAALAAEPPVDLDPPRGYFVVARLGSVPVGIGGVRWLAGRTAELTKIFTVRSARGRGVASSVLEHLESHARGFRQISIRLDTKSGLDEACRLYERRGYLQVEQFGSSPYSDRWYELSLSETEPRV
nr:GNAT family N-acetyltransferase [Rhodococcus sp. (in: high G+C Gram-positive bacteria)]